MSSDRIRGVLMGQMVGDAFGARYEFKKAGEVQEMFNSNKTIAKAMQNGNTDAVPMLGGRLFRSGDEKDTMNGYAEPRPTQGKGIFELKDGEFTDDSEMALSLASSLLVNSGFHRQSIVCAYVRWEKTNPPFIGYTTAMALEILEQLPSNWMVSSSTEQKEKVLNDVLKNVRINPQNKQSLSNGFLMRISPLPAFYHNQPFDSWSKFVAEDVGLTHAHPAAIDAALIYTQAIHQLINKATPEIVYQNALSSATTQIVKMHLELASKQRIPVPHGEGMSLLTNGDDTVMGYMGVALQTAFHELLHAKSFSEGLVNAVLIGGDTDTNGCIVAALLGAHFGETGIPLKWRKKVQNAAIRIKGENGIISVKEIVQRFAENGTIANSDQKSTNCSCCSKEK